MGGEAQTPKSWMEIVWRQLISPHINLCRHMQGFAAFIASCMECLVAMQRLHSNICSRLQGFTAFIASCMECLVAAQQYMCNICKWLQGCTAFIASCVECFGGNAATAQQYMRVAAGLAQPLFNYAWKNLDCGLGDMATDHTMLWRRDPLQKVLLQGVPLQQKSLTLQYKRRASPSQIPFPPPT